MSETVYLLDMFPDYEPPEEIRKALSQAALVAVDIRAENRSVEADRGWVDYRKCISWTREAFVQRTSRMP